MCKVFKLSICSSVMIPMNDSNTLSLLSVIQAAHNSDIKKEMSSPKHARPPDASGDPPASDAASSACITATSQSQQLPVGVFTIYNPTPVKGEEPSAKRRREDEDWGNH